MLAAYNRLYCITEITFHTLPLSDEHDRTSQMDRPLNRSKSLRLRPTPNENFSKPLPRSDSLAFRDVHRARGDAAVGGVFAGNSILTQTETRRPSTAGGQLQHESLSEGDKIVRVYTPTSPAVLFAAEVRSRPLPSPISPGKAITTDYADPHSTCWPLEENSPPRGSGSNKPAVGGDGAKPKLTRWKSLKGFFGRKSLQTTPSAQITTPSGYQVGRASPHSAPSRSATTSRATTRSRLNGESPQPPQRLASTPSQSKRSVQTYTPTRGSPSRTTTQRQNSAERNTGFQGGYKYQGGMTTAATNATMAKPMIDVEIPDIHLERYSVMFDELMQTGTEPNLLSRRRSKSKAGRPEPLQTEALRAPEPSYLDTKPCPPTPRSAAKYQLSLFPTPAAQFGTLNPLGMHKPRPLQRSQTSPSQRSPNAYGRTYQPSISSMATSEEVPLRLEVAADDASRLAPPPLFAMQVTDPPTSPGNQSDITQRPSSEHSSLNPAPVPDSHVADDWYSVADGPDWHAISEEKTRNRTSSQSTDDSAAFTAMSDETAVEQPVVQVSVARQMSLTRARSTRKNLENQKWVTPMLMDKRPITPTVVQLGHRAKQRSFTVEIEGC